MTFTRSAKVGKFTAVMMLSDAGAFHVSWSPSLPGALSADELKLYMDARNRLIWELSAALKRNEAIVQAYNRAVWTDTL